MHCTFNSKMILLCYMFFLCPGSSYGDLQYYEESSETLSSCIKNITSRYFEKRITYVDINSEDDEVLKVINTSNRQLVISRTASKKLQIPHEQYLICAGNFTDFIKNVGDLTKELTWNPSKSFIIIVKELFKNRLRYIFNELLVLHVNDVIVVNGTNTAEVYTYNAFENYACGRYFERIIEFGQCLNSNDINLFPNKFKTGLKNCTFTVAVPHFPPLTIVPSSSDLKLYLPGNEQYAFEMIADQEQFKIKYLYMDVAEEFSNIDENMKAEGILELIQKNQTDVVIGFTILTNKRSAAFENLYAHLAFTDDLSYFVKKAGSEPIWMNVFMEFSFVVWFLLFLSFLSSSVSIIFLLRTNDKVAIIMKLWGNLLSHGHNIQCGGVVKFVLIIWAWFAWFMGSFYQSSLVSLTAYPSKTFQVTSENDLIKFHFRPCITSAIQNFLYDSSGLTFKEDTGKCQKLVQGIEVVGNTEDIFTICPLAIYQYNKYLFEDATGTPKVYVFAHPALKLIYAIFLYKGFPMSEKLHVHCLRLRENGLMDRHFRWLSHNQALLHRQYFDSSFKACPIVPWNILLVGSVLAAIIFVLEILYKRMM